MSSLRAAAQEGLPSCSISTESRDCFLRRLGCGRYLTRASSSTQRTIAGQSPCAICLSFFDCSSPHHTIDFVDANCHLRRAARLRWGFQAWNSSAAIGDLCLASRAHAPWMCMSAPTAALFVNTPVFFVNSVIDSCQVIAAT
jgi:hypothetical protein